jgi:hypothetical protein
MSCGAEVIGGRSASVADAEGSEGRFLAGGDWGFVTFSLRSKSPIVATGAYWRGGML